MLRIWFIGGYALFLIVTILLMAIKVISVIGRDWMGQTAKQWADTLFAPQNALLWGGILLTSFVAWVLSLLKIAKNSPEWERKWVKTLVVGCSFMCGFFLVLAVVGGCAFTFEGFAGEVAAKVAGFMSSPVFMEISFFSIGLLLLLTYNVVRRIIDGDDFVEMEIKDDEPKGH